MRKPMGLKVINLGLPKSGTTTLSQAMKKAGFSVADHRLRRREASDDPKDRVFVGNLLYQGLYEHGDPMALMPGYDAVSEISFISGRHSVWPQCDFALLKILRDLYPDLKFIATRRNLDAQARSIMGWNNLGTHRLPNSNVPGLPIGFGGTEDEQKRWIAGHHAALNHWFRNDPAFLEVDIAAPNARRAISEHLGRELPWWGIANASTGKEN